MSEPVFDAETWMDVAAPAMGLTLDPAWRGEIAFHLALVARAAAFVGEAPKEALESEPAPIFTPGSVV